MRKTLQPEAATGEISGFLRAWSEGDQDALAKLTPIVFDQLHRLARRHMRGERSGHSLQTTAWSMKPTCAWWTISGCGADRGFFAIRPR